jgi:UDPglucose--hexose-1-phosphate uridylyltransferase
MQQSFDLNSNPHTRLNILTGERVLVSPHCTKRPWKGKVEKIVPDSRAEYDPKCYFCRGNVRADGPVNAQYRHGFVFKNDFSTLLEDTPYESLDVEGLLVANSESGVCKVVAFSPKHYLTLPEFSLNELASVVNVWQKEYNVLAGNEWIRYIQIFENKGEDMGCKNPHPRGQI